MALISHLCGWQIDEVAAFVRSNVRRLLGVDSAICFPVSARKALKAKLAAEWPAEESGFCALERFIRGFLEGSTDLGAERLRLKLDTPLGVGAALLAACERQLGGETERARANKRSLREVEGQVAARREGMEQEGALQRQRVAATVGGGSLGGLRGQGGDVVGGGVGMAAGRELQAGGGVCGPHAQTLQRGRHRALPHHGRCGQRGGEASWKPAV